MRGKLLKALTVGLGSTAFVFFGFTLASSWSELETASFAPEPEWAASIILLTLATVVSGYLWKSVVRAYTGFKTSPREAMGIHFGAWIIRYVPTIGSVTYKSLWLISKGFRLRLASVPIIVEGFYVQITSFVVGIGLLTPTLLEFEDVLLFIWIAIPVALLVAPFIFLNPSLTRRLLRLSNEESLLGLANKSAQLWLLPSYLVPRLINAAAAAVIGMSAGIGDMRDWLALGGAFLIAAALGFLVPFVPSGLGIREGMFVGVLFILGWDATAAVTISIVLRFLTTASDLVIAALWALLRRGTSLARHYDRRP